jgi:4'-phosphopantetheinyl transferase
MVYLSYLRMLEPFSTQVFEDYLLQLPSAMQAKVCQFRRWEDSHTALMGKILLKEMASAYFNFPDILDQISYSETKKPIVAGSLSFNSSHSDDMVVCAIGENCRLGVDVEKIVDVDFTHLQDYMTESEWNQIQHAKDPNEDFLKYWTQKEAVIKADGRGLSIPIKEVEIQNSVVTIGPTSWYTLEVNLAKGYACHIASSNRLTSEELICFEFGKSKTL